MAKNLDGFYYNLAGGVNLSKSKIGLGIDSRKLYWDDSFNIEPLKNQGVCSQKGNRLLVKLEAEEKIMGIFEFPKNSNSFVFVTEKGKIYYYDSATKDVTLEKHLPHDVRAANFAHFNGGVLILTDTNPGEFFKLSPDKDLETIEAENIEGKALLTTRVAVYASRVWLADGSTLYFSALGNQNDWTTPQDAGYISKFFSSTTEIVALCEYNGCLAVYKEDGVYLLSGSNPGEFSISRFADIGAISTLGVLTDNNKQYFINNNGVFALEQSGDLAQIALSENIAHNIQPYFQKIDFGRARQTLALSRKIKNQLWFFIPYLQEEYLNTAWIFDYFCGAWFKRVIPYKIVTAAAVGGEILTGSALGEIFIENTGNNFASKPIEFRFSTPFFHLGLPNTRKIIENLNFIFDEEVANTFRFSVSKDYIPEERTDIEFVSTLHPDTLIFVGGGGENGNLGSEGGDNGDTLAPVDLKDRFNSCWAFGGDEIQIREFLWATTSEEAYRTEVFDSNLAVQLHLEGFELGDEFALVGIEFKEVLIDE